jgi:hypothetical protein
MIGRLFATIAVLLSSIAGGVGLTPASASTCTLTVGAVVQLSGTPHLFIVDERRILHWGGDTRALSGRSIDWNNRCSVALDALRQMQRGDPWLSSGLPKIGDPIYLSKWEDSEQAPTLLHIQSIADVELFGINERNYGNFVLDRPMWESRYGFTVSSLQLGPLASAHSFAWSSTDQSSYLQLLTNMRSVLSTALYRASQAGTDGVLLIPAIADCERAGLNEFDRNRNASNALNTTQECLSRLSLGGGPGPVPGGPVPGQGIPFPPANVRVLALSPTVIRVMWSDGPNDFGYRIYGGDQTVPSTLFVTGTPANATNQDLPGRSPNTTYCYAVSAFNPAGESPLSGPICATTPASGNGGLNAPTNLAISQIMVGSSVGGLRLDWTDASSVESAFQIVRGDQQLATVGANTTSYTDLGWTPTLPNCYRVVAIKDQDQASSELACLGGGTGANPPAAPTGFHLSVTPGVTGVQLSWTDASSSEMGFQVLRNDQVLATLGVNVQSYTDPSWNAANPPCYKVVAFNNYGQGVSERVCSTMGNSQPAAPADLLVSPAFGRTLRLDWGDTSTNEDGFQILRNNLLISTVDANVLSFTDPNPESGQNCYRVAAYNTTGAAYSDQVCRTR